MFCKSYNDFFGTLANATNQRIIDVLRLGAKNVSEIARITKLEQSKISHALKRLADCKFVDMEQKGKQRIYSLNKDTIIPVLKLADEHAHKMCPVCNKITLKAT